MIFNMFTEIRNWALERGIYDKGYNLKAEVKKDIEETFELMGNSKRKTNELTEHFMNRYSGHIYNPPDKDIVDAHCDKIVFAVNAIEALGYDARLCMAETIAEISSRKGAMNEETGKWEKFTDDYHKSLHYKADYSKCKRVSE
jgi:hypothetical protein